MTKSWLKEGPDGRIEWLSRRAENSMHNAGRLVAGNYGCSVGLGLDLPAFLFLAGSAFPAELQRCAGHRHIRVWHPHHLVCDAICLVLKRIVALSNNELCL